jgi:hypothetical protein
MAAFALLCLTKGAMGEEVMMNIQSVNMRIMVLRSLEFRLGSLLLVPHGEYDQRNDSRDYHNESRTDRIGYLV